MSTQSHREWIAVKDLATRCGVGVNTIWRWSRDPQHPFPSPAKLGPNCTRWRLADVEAFEADCKGVA
ncbi:helix-turn-helix transcriptional regulator [Halomonas sp.]|uniref:helix-turn-helix transcriptional regulator n=1 Tax=Halomonas sp. TaxID=1486246 RepID=UPI003A94EE20